MNEQPPVRLITLARLLGLPPAWLREEADAGRIPHLRIGRVRLFDPDAVRLALKKRAASGEGVRGG